MRSWSLQVCAASLVLVGCAAAPLSQQSQRGQEDSRDFDRLVVELAQIVRAKLTTSGGTKCENLPPGGECLIRMTLIRYNSRDYCLAEAPDVKVSETGTKEKFINWTLDKADFGGSPIEFHGEVGVVMVGDTKHDLIDTDPKSRGHGNGDVVGMPVPRHKFHIKTKKKGTVAIAAYLPVVLWDPNKNGEWELCAAIDPKIVNTP